MDAQADSDSSDIMAPRECFRREKLLTRPSCQGFIGNIAPGMSKCAEVRKSVHDRLKREEWHLSRRDSQR